MIVSYIGFGSNLGDREAVFEKALERLHSNRFVSLKKVSPVYETEPVGYLPQGRFLNAVWEFETELPPQALFQELLRVENYFGRERHGKNGPRTIDLDLLAYGDLVLNGHELIVPHPRLHERIFVLKPFSDVNPAWIHPRFHRSIKDLLANVTDCQ